MDTLDLQFKVKKALTEGEAHYVEGVVYAPNTPDTYFEFMTAENIQLMAHRFLKDVTLGQSIDIKHDNVATECSPVQSYIAKANDPDGYPEGAWILRVEVTDEIFEKVQKGELNGYSFEAYVTKVPAVITVEYYPQVVLETEEAGDPPHKHLAVVDFNELGRVVKGYTSVEHGHTHDIISGTATQAYDNHVHRIIL